MVENGSPFDFPCEIPVKVFGRNDDDFREALIDIVAACFPGFDARNMVERPSREGRYLSITVTVYAEDRTQIDALYTRLSAHDAILMAL